MLPGRSKATLTRFLRDQSPKWRNGVEVVVTDGSTPYKAAIEQYLPKAQHVLDRFHVIRWFGQLPGATPPGLATPPPPRPAARLGTILVPLPLSAPQTKRPPQRSRTRKTPKPVRPLPPIGNRMASPPRTPPSLPSAQPRGGPHSPRQVHRPLPNRPNTPIPQNRKNHPPLARPNPRLPHHRTIPPTPKQEAANNLLQKPRRITHGPANPQNYANRALQPTQP